MGTSRLSSEARATHCPPIVTLEEPSYEKTAEPTQAELKASLSELAKPCLVIRKSVCVCVYVCIHVCAFVDRDPT